MIGIPLTQPGLVDKAPNRPGTKVVLGHSANPLATEVPPPSLFSQLPKFPFAADAAAAAARRTSTSGVIRAMPDSQPTPLMRRNHESRRCPEGSCAAKAKMSRSGGFFLGRG